MNANDIDAMPAGPEMDALVAEKVMGWEVHPRNTAHWRRKGDDGCDYRVMGDVGDWRPSRDIAAAWEVVEKTKHLVPVIRLCGNGLEWMASYTMSGAYSVAETPMLAIVRAALKAVLK